MHNPLDLALKQLEILDYSDPADLDPTAHAARVQEIRSWILQAARVLRRVRDAADRTNRDLHQSDYAEAAILVGPRYPDQPATSDCCEGAPL